MSGCIREHALYSLHLAANRRNIHRTCKIKLVTLVNDFGLCTSIGRISPNIRRKLLICFNLLHGRILLPLEVIRGIIRNLRIIAAHRENPY